MSNSKIQSALFSLILIGHSQAAFNNPTALINREGISNVLSAKIRSVSPQPSPTTRTSRRGSSLSTSQKSWSRLFVSTSSDQDPKMTTAADVGDENGSNINGSESTNKSYSKLRTLKDRMWVREALEDLTAAEFACSLSGNNEEKEKKANNKRAVDFENVLTKLDRRIEDMCVLSTYGEEDSSCIVSYPLTWDGEITDVEAGKSTKIGDECWTLKKELGMGSVTYTDDQRSALVM